MNIEKKTTLLAAFLSITVAVSVLATLQHFQLGPYSLHALGQDGQSKGNRSAQHALTDGTDGAPLLSLSAAASGYQHHPGQDNFSDFRPDFKEIKSLTADEIRAYQEGTGYGMAKAAEQNHYPGPRHVLDLAEQLQLEEEQKRQIRGIRDLTRVAAISAGRQLIADESRLNLLFADNKMDKTQLISLVAEIAALQGKLRLIHLNAHFETQKILSPAQIGKYDQLRGYTNPEKSLPGSGK